MRPADLDLLVTTGPASLTPTGDLAVVAVSRPDVAHDEYRSALWVVPTDGGPARRLTNGPRDSAPAVSPDGETVAFLRAGPDAPAQVHLTALAGGEPLRLTDHPLGAGAPSWSPDGTRLLYTARVPEPGRYGTDDTDGKKSTAETEPPRLITEPAYRVDDLGFTRDRRPHVFVLDIPASATVPGTELPEVPLTPRQLTTGDADDQGPVWSPDGTVVAFVSARHASAERDLRSAAYAVPADAAEPVERPEPLTDGDVSVAAVQWLPDERLVLAAADVGAEGLDFVGRGGRLFVTEGPVGLGAGVREMRVLTDEDHDLEADGPRDLVVAGGRVLVRELHRGAVRLLAVSPDDGSVEYVVDDRLVVTAQATSYDGSTIVVAASGPDRYGDLAVVADGGLRWLTDVSTALRDAGLRPARELEATTADGHQVHGWVLLPDPETYGEGPHPVLLIIHGGPFTQYQCSVFDEAQVYAGAGYAVLMCNPRGSAGYGPEHGRSIRHAMGGVDAEDLEAFLDHALAIEPLLDAGRVGVMGGSYGGYMTAWLTTRTTRFAAAVVERGYLDGRSFVGSSDIGWFFPGEYHGSPDAVVEQSPMTYVAKVSTPTLVVHSEHDWRCPVEQGQRWFTALRAQGVPTELLLFPGEGHELSRSGRPRHRRQRFDHLLRWWARQLPVSHT